MNENRLRDVLSKVGHVQSTKQAGMLTGKYHLLCFRTLLLNGPGMLSKDALESFERDNEDFGKELTKKEQRTVFKHCANLCHDLVFKYIDAIVAGEF